MEKKTLGQWKGLDALFLENSEEETERNAKRTLKIALVEPKTGQPRKTFDELPLQQLAESIATYGVLQPILVRELPNGKYSIVAGERRWRASKLAGLTEIPAIILDGDEKEAAQIALVENIQRENLNPLEEAMAYRSLAEEYRMTQEEIAAKIGKSRSAIANAERLLDLPEEILARVASGDLSAGHARTLLSLRDPADRVALGLRAMEEDWSVRVLEQEVKRFLRRKKAEALSKEEPDNAPRINYAEILEGKLMRELGRRVQIQESPRKKTITFFYEDNEDLDNFLRRLCGDALDEE